MRLIRYGLILVSMISFRALQAQEFGGNPPYIKWRQINTSAARVIFPRGLDSIANQVAGVLDQVSKVSLPSIGPSERKIDIVLQNETTVSNGYVALGPYRSEFYLTPLQNSFSLGSLPWHKQLALHEYRHVQQYNNFNVGLSKVFRTLFGEEGQALGNSLSVPDWFFEGDAVFNETRFSNQGRGRLPFFFNGYRALWEAEKNYSWMKLRNGSLLDFTPDHYQSGYLLVAYGRNRYGPEFWKNVSRDAAAFKGLIYPLQKAIRKYAGVSYRAFRTEALEYFKASTRVSKPEPALYSGHFESNKEFPAVIDDSTIVYVRSSYSRLPAFTIRRGNRETSVRTRDVSLDRQFSYKNGYMVYASYRPDERWGWKDYGELQLLDLHTGHQQRLTRRTKYFSPDISEDGATIVAVDVQPGGRSAFHLIDAKNGRLKAAIPNPDGLFPTYPKFYSPTQIVAAVRDSAGRMALTLIDANTGESAFLTPFTFNVIGFPAVSGDTVYFTASYNGNDRLYACLVQKKELYLLSHGLMESTTGNYQPAVSGNKLFWSHFTAVGYRLEEVERSTQRWEALAASQFAEATSNFRIAAVESPGADLLSVTRTHTATDYPKTFHLVNFHSLRPLVNDPDYSISIAGENVLNTLQSELYFGYNRNEGYKQAGFRTTYGGWYPQITGSVNYTLDRRALFRNQRIYWNEWELSAGAAVPLNLSKGRFLTGLRAGADYVFNQPRFRGVFKDSISSQSFGYINSYVSFTNQVQTARQHIYPRYGQTFTVNYKRSVSRFEASQLLFSGGLYLPGLRRTHNLVFTGAFQQRDTLNQRSFSNSFPFSRGYTSENLFRMIRIGVNYHFPLFYPDAGFGDIVYCLRVRANLFYDHTRATDDRLNSALFRSAGTEIYFDTRWWNQLPLSFGFRYSLLLDRNLFGADEKSRFELVLPINLLQR